MRVYNIDNASCDLFSCDLDGPSSTCSHVKQRKRHISLRSAEIRVIYLDDEGTNKAIGIQKAVDTSEFVTLTLGACFLPPRVANLMNSGGSQDDDQLGWRPHHLGLCTLLCSHRFVSRPLAEKVKAVGLNRV